MTQPAPDATRALRSDRPRALPAPAAAPAAAPEGPPQWTLERMDLFVRTLLRTGNVSAAARAAGMSRKAAYALRARLPGHPFDQAWEAATAPQARFRRLIADGGRVVPQSRGLQGVTPGNRG